MKGLRIGRIRAVLTVATVGALSFTTVAAIAQISKPAGPRAVASGDFRGPRGPAGPRGPRGYTGTRGPRGPAGTTPTLIQSISINWQGSFSNASGRDTQMFVVPRMGYGQVACTPDTQWVWFTPYDPKSDIAMWTLISRGNETVVRTARHTLHTGNSFYEGLNQYRGQQESRGSFTGIISKRGTIHVWNGGPGPPPTTFQLSWYWNFSDANNPYCFVAGSFISNGSQ